MTSTSKILFGFASMCDNSFLFLLTFLSSFQLLIIKRLCSFIIRVIFVSIVALVTMTLLQLLVCEGEVILKQSDSKFVSRWLYGKRQLSALFSVTEILRTSHLWQCDYPLSLTFTNISHIELSDDSSYHKSKHYRQI